MREDNDYVAGHALNALINKANIGNFSNIKGILHLTLFQQGLDPTVKELNFKTMTEIEASSRRELAEIEAFRQKSAASFKRQKTFHDKYMKRNLNNARTEADRLVIEKSSDVSAAIASLKETERRYRDFMKLEAPVEYWSTKAKDHRKSAKKYSYIATSWLCFSLIIVFIGFWYLPSYAQDFIVNNKPSSVLLVVASLSLILTTMVFWFMRILMRLFLSEHHLGIDADERAIMAQTYLALSAENAAEPAERHIVLSTLFRPTADGIVKDDGAPEFSPSALLSRITSR